MAINIPALSAELIAGHPDTGAYDADNTVAAGQGNAVNRTINKTSMSSSEIFNAFNKAEFNALSDADKAIIWNLLSFGSLNPFGLEATLFTDIFGGGSTTITTLQADRKTDVSRMVELGIGVIGSNHIELARRS